MIAILAIVHTESVYYNSVVLVVLKQNACRRLLFALQCLYIPVSFFVAITL